MIIFHYMINKYFYIFLHHFKLWNMFFKRSIYIISFNNLITNIFNFF